MGKRKSEREAPEADEEVRLYRRLTPNQVVAYNLAQARAWRGWTQDEAAVALEPYLGVRWSKASFSQAERSITGRIARNFSADEIVAFARAFKLPVTWFFMPPPPLTDAGPAILDTPDAGVWGEPLSLLVDLIFGDDEQQAVVALRLAAFLDQLGDGPITAAQERIKDHARVRVAALARDAFRDTERLQNQLRWLANQLEDREAQAKRVTAEELKIDLGSLGGTPTRGGVPPDEEGSG